MDETPDNSGIEGTKVETKTWGTAVACINQCDVSEENPVLDDGYCQSCHDYPDGP